VKNRYWQLNIATFAVAFLLILSGCQTKPAGNPAELFSAAQDLQKQEKYQDAIKIYQQIAKEFPKSREGSNSQFMIGFIYANHLQDYTKAKAELETFLAKFTATADSGLIEGAKFELRFMGKPIDDIPNLSETNNTATAKVDTDVK